jgi:hypothetical protein
VTELARVVRILGEELMTSPAQCVEESNTPSIGSPPRGLVLEVEGRDTAGRGAVVVGINPGRSKSKERAYFEQFGPTFETWEDYWKGHLKEEHPYFKRLRLYVTSVGISGPILWTNLAGCETPRSAGRSPQIQTLRFCARQHLWKELDVVPKDWVLVGAGKEAFMALSYLRPDQTVLGCPHPTGAYHHFSRLFDGQNLRPELRAKVARYLESQHPWAAWCGVGRDDPEVSSR